jgi:hypothetical protein
MKLKASILYVAVITVVNTLIDCLFNKKELSLTLVVKSVLVGILAVVLYNIFERYKRNKQSKSD